MIYDYEKKILQIKIVYYGPAMSGKTTSIKYLFAYFNKEDKVTSIDNTVGRTLFFDFGVLPFKGAEWNLNCLVYTATGQDFYASTRPATLNGVDGIIFVADSRVQCLHHNLRSWNELRTLFGNKAHTIPIIISLNKYDIKNIWSLTYKSDGTRRKIYLYFLPKNSRGFGYRDSPYNYLPVMSSPEWNLFNSMPSQQARGIVLDPEHPELFDPSEILAAMNIESALCVARTSDMADNEILFAFDEFQPYMPHLVKNENYRIIGPSPDGLTEKNTHEFLTLYFKYWQIIQRFRGVSLYTFDDPNDFFEIFDDNTDSLIWFITQYNIPPIFDPRWYK